MSDKGFDFQGLKRVVRMGMQRKGLFYGVITIAILGALLSVFRPSLVGNIIDDYILKSDLPGLYHQLLILAGILLGEVLLQFGMVYLANYIAQQVIYDLRTRLFNHLLGFRLSYFDRTPNGVLVTRSVSDIETVAQVFNDGILVILGDVLRIIFIVITMFYLNWVLTLVVLVILPLMFIITRFFQRALKKVYQAERTLTAKLNSFVQERLTGMNILQLFNREEAELEKFKSINLDLKNAYLKTVLYFSLLFPVVEVVSALTIGGLIWFGGLRTAVEGDVSVGNIIAFVMFTQMLIRPMRQVAERFNSIQRGLVGADRVFKILDKEESLQNNGQFKTERLDGTIEFDDVRFSYVPDEEVLKGISFKTKPGSTVAIVGATGAGKSTIINLLSRFYDIDSGSITIDGKSIYDFELSELRKHIVVVLQDVFLFNTTIYDNIVMGNPNIKETEVVEAAKAIGVHEFIESLPQGYHSPVNERGNSLSVGQRQLISFLRAYVYNPEILVLDEATSSIDTESEELIQKATEKLTKGRTSIVIAHRLATIQNADKIIVLQRGKIMEMGRHQELIDNDGYYKTLYEAQFKQASINI